MPSFVAWVTLSVAGRLCLVLRSCLPIAFSEIRNSVRFPALIRAVFLPIVVARFEDLESRTGELMETVLRLLLMIIDRATVQLAPLAPVHLTGTLAVVPCALARPILALPVALRSFDTPAEAPEVTGEPPECEVTGKSPE
jgi:hypothetical protein